MTRPPNGHLDRDMLDQISDTVPLWVAAYAPHIVYANTPMIELIGVDDSGLHGLGRYPDGRLNGWFIETAQRGRPSSRSRPRSTETDSARGRRPHGSRRQAAGITTTTDMLWGIDNFEPSGTTTGPRSTTAPSRCAC